MSQDPIRRSQLIAPFGVGALSTLKNGVSVITGGLDYWFQREDTTDNRHLSRDEFKFHEWRLQDLLLTDHFMKPPDFRIPFGYGRDTTPNLNLHIPHLKFPAWHYCRKSRCNHMHEYSLSDSENYKKCPKCNKGNLVQVPFIAICERGHIQDFPWREWIHYSINPSCNKDLTFKASGGASLSNIKIICDCGASRSMANVLKMEQLTNSLDKSEKYKCQCGKPWLGLKSDPDDTCDGLIKGSLRTTTNVYFPDMRSSIVLPRENIEEALRIIATIKENDSLSKKLLEIEMRHNISVENDITFDLDVSDFRESDELGLLNVYEDGIIKSVVSKYLNKERLVDVEIMKVESDDKWTTFKREEYKVVSKECENSELNIVKSNIIEQNDKLNQYFSEIFKVKKLTEARVFAGFSRIHSRNDDLDQKKRLLRRSSVKPHTKNDWLPGYEVHGEGILFNFNERNLREWETSSSEISDRMRILSDRYNNIFHESKVISPRFVLIHTFAHLMINQLVFECGYHAASLRERLYVSEDKENPMASVLIYTAAGDSDGTLGGLVRMADSDFLPITLETAINNATWCSSDPVCMEVGSRIEDGGQGPYRLNLAACHNCSLVPETSCEYFNYLLDRGLLIGDPSNNIIGYFQDYI